ncbi:hypothetical protein [Sedimenticola thiotaurini]|uniref:hypothetical protein n=1 Tax=Sedimenticola thiotaurini TaxID=1543721 RepID=UPI0018FFFF9D|nr:hypothetical protein [Sedimenticola thiotaurini]
MLNKLDKEICHRCPHEVVTGVACDWRPMDQCPYLASETSPRRSRGVHLVPLPLSSETDAIRSID